MVTFHSYQRRHGSFERITGGAGDASDLTLEFLEISGKGMGPHWYPQNRFVEMSQNENSLVDIYIYRYNQIYVISQKPLIFRYE